MRLLSVSHHLVLATVVQLCEVATADNSVFTFVSAFSRVLSCALGCSCVELLDRCTLIRHLLGRWRRLHDQLMRYLDSLLFQLVGRHALGRLLQHLVVCCLVWSSPLRYHVCRKTCQFSCLSDASLRVTSPFGAVVRATHGLVAYGPQGTMGVLAGTHWGDESPRVMSHQSTKSLRLCRAGGHGRDRGLDLSCGHVLWTSFMHALFKHTSSAREVWLSSLRVVSR